MTTPEAVTISDAVAALEEARGNLRAASLSLRDHPEVSEAERLLNEVTAIETRLAQQVFDERERHSIA